MSESPGTEQKIQSEHILAHYRATQELTLDVRRSMWAAAHAAIKNSMLMNGGASVAMLAFIGHVQDSQTTHLLPGLVRALTIFAFGTLLVVLGSALAYLSEASLDASLHQKDKQEYFTRWWGYFSWAAILSVFASYVLFVVAVIQTSTTILK